MERLAALLFGYGWKSALAEALNTNRRTVSRWIARDAVPEWAASRLRAMAHVAPPPGSTADQDRDAACAEALEPDLTRLVEIAEAAGWERAEIDTALLALVVSDVLRLAGREPTLDLLRQAMDQVADQT